MATVPTPVDSLPTPPSISSPSTFDSLADAFIAALVTFRSQINALASNVYTNAVECFTNSQTASDAAVVATAQANAAVAAAHVSAWVSGTTYAVGDCRYSPINLQSYRRSTAGAGTTDPSIDADNWTALGGAGSSSATSLIYASTTFGGF